MLSTDRLLSPSIRVGIGLFTHSFPRGTYRTGIDEKTGKRWTSRMAAHYGYVAGTKGADGDGVDCFVGVFHESEFAYVVNQNINGVFDEHKIIFAYPDAASARQCYRDSYDRDWPGFASMVTASISQIKWWLKNGNMKKPLHPTDLPPEGLEAMSQTPQWSADALPIHQTIDQLLYDIRRSDHGENLMLDSVTLADIMEDADGALAFDALVVPFESLERKMAQLQRVMERASLTVKPVAMQVTEPFSQRGVANVATLFELSDGQTVSIYFHNPDVTPKKMMGTDEVISWKWLLNKKDITIVVAPERGADLNISEVARRIMKLAEKNSAAFQRVNAKKAESMQRLGDLKAEITGLEKELKTALNDLEVAKIEQEDRVAKAVETAKADKVAAKVALYEVGSTNSKTGRWNKDGILNVSRAEGGLYLWSVETSVQRSITNTVEVAFEWLSGVLSGMGDAVSGTDVDRAKVLSRLKFKSGEDLLNQVAPVVAVPMPPAAAPEQSAAPVPVAAPADSAKDVVELDIKTHPSMTLTDVKLAGVIAKTDGLVAEYKRNPGDKQAASGAAAFYAKRNNVPTIALPGNSYMSMVWQIQAATDDPKRAVVTSGNYPCVIALPDGKVYGALAVVSGRIQEAPVVTAESVDAPVAAGGGANLPPVQPPVVSAPAEPVNPGAAPSEQDLIDAYAKAQSAKVDKINAAVAAVNWPAITNFITANIEIKTLGESVKLAYDTKSATSALEKIGIKSWDDRLSFINEGPESKRYGEAMARYHDALKKIQAKAKEGAKEQGIKELAALPADAPIEDYAPAIYKKNGIDTGDRGDYLGGIVEALTKKDADYLRDIIGNLDNKASREIFERYTGVKLAKTKAGSLIQADAWADISLKQRTQIEIDKKDTFQAKDRASDVNRTWDTLRILSIRNDDSLMDGQQWVLKSVADGYSEIGTVKRGAVFRYGLINATGELNSVKTTHLTNFLVAAHKYGGLKQALAFVGAVVPEKNELAAADAPIELTGKELGDFPEGGDGYQAMHAAAIAYFEERLIGKSKFNASLKSDVFVRKSGAKKIAKLGTSRLKMKLIPATLSLISKAVKQHSAPSTSATERNIKAYHYMRAEAKVGGEVAMVWMIVKEDDRAIAFNPEPEGTGVIPCNR